MPPLLLDSVLVALLLLWWVGGVSWQGKQVLTHGADPRRAALLIAAAAALVWPALWDRSLVLRAARALWRGLETPRGRRFALGGAAVLAAVIGCLQALALRVPMYDVGIFHQILWALSHGHGFVSTISGAGDFLRDHLSPSLALLVPAYWVGASSALTLQILHPTLLFAGVAAWVWLAEQIAPEASRSRLAAAVTVFGLVFESLWGNLHWGFHENAISFAALSWAFALLLARPERRLGIGVLLLVAAGSKEILLVDVAVALGVWAFLERARSRVFSVAALAGAVGLLVAFVLFEGGTHPADKNYFDRYYSYLGHGLVEFARTLLLSPWVVVQNVGAAELGRYFWVVLSPWLFMPLLFVRLARRQALWLLVVLPSLASAGLATYPPLRSAQFHYVLELWPALAAVTILILSRLPSSSRWATAWAFFALLSWDRDPLGDLREYGRGAAESAPVRQAMAQVPADQSVAADELSGTWLAGRLEASRWPALPRPPQCPSWLILRDPEQMTLARQRCALGEARSVGAWFFVEARSL